MRIGPLDKADPPMAESDQILRHLSRSRSIVDGDIALIFNTTEGWQSLKDSESIRASALSLKIPYFTTAPASVAAARAIAALAVQSLEVRPLQSYYSQSHN